MSGLLQEPNSSALSGWSNPVAIPLVRETLAFVVFSIMDLGHLRTRNVQADPDGYCGSRLSVDRSTKADSWQSRAEFVHGHCRNRCGV